MVGQREYTNYPLKSVSTPLLVGTNCLNETLLEYKSSSRICTEAMYYGCKGKGKGVGTMKARAQRAWKGEGP